MRRFIWALPIAACIDASSPRTTEVEADTASETTGASDGDTGGTADIGEPCQGPGATRCNTTATALEVCIDGAWQATDCGQGRACLDLGGGAQCLDTSGDATCRVVLYCYVGCQAAPASLQDACVLDCGLSGTPQAQFEIGAVLDCLERAECNGAGSAGATLDCIAEQCPSPLAQCYFDASGPELCASILACREGCDAEPDPEACSLSCGENATLAAQGDYAVLEMCIFYTCGEAMDEAEREDCMEDAVGVTGACFPYVRACVNPLDD